MVENDKKMPFFQKKEGTLQIAVWENTNAYTGKWFTTKLVRNFLDKDGTTWRKTYSLRSQDLFPAIKLLEEASNKISWEASKASAPSPRGKDGNLQYIPNELDSHPLK